MQFSVITINFNNTDHLAAVLVRVVLFQLLSLGEGRLSRFVGARVGGSGGICGSGGVSGFAGVCRLAAAGNQCHGHDQGKDQCDDSFHGISSYVFYLSYTPSCRGR